MNSDDFDLAAQEARAEEAKANQKRQQQEEKNDLHWLMSKKQGRRIMYRLLDRAGVFTTSFNTNAMTMAFNEGRRNEGLALTNDIMGATPELWQQMIVENKTQ